MMDILLFQSFPRGFQNPVGLKKYKQTTLSAFETLTGLTNSQIVRRGKFPIPTTSKIAQALFYGNLSRFPNKSTEGAFSSQVS